ncbi:alpha/beta hydrolase [Nonomuraea sp. NPDC003709]|uniref:alpha/beta fold hydrolase n=1 Tax=Nonomuraea sp. NPDC003709 TaxID=3154450 RepID=UPI0033AFC11F
MRHDEMVCTVSGSLVRAYRAGDGPELVLLHGGGLDSARLTWEPVWTALAAHARVTAPDLPGFGGTPLGTTEPTLIGYAAWLREFLDTCTTGPVAIAGLSLGGGIALRVALDQPDRVAKLALCAPYGVSPSVAGGRAGYLAVHAPYAPAASNALMRRSDRLLRAGLRAVLHRRDAVTAGLLAEVRAALSGPDAGVAWSAFQRDEVRWNGPRTCFGDELTHLACPALLLCGAKDTLVPPGDVRAAAALIPDARFALVPDAGHWLPRDAPERVAKELVSFLTSTAPTPPAP